MNKVFLEGLLVSEEDFVTKSEITIYRLVIEYINDNGYITKIPITSFIKVIAKVGDYVRIKGAITTYASTTTDAGKTFLNITINCLSLVIINKVEDESDPF